MVPPPDLQLDRLWRLEIDCTRISDLLWDSFPMPLAIMDIRCH